MPNIILVTLTLLGLALVSNSVAQAKTTPVEAVANAESHQLEPILQQAEADLYKEEDEQLKKLESAPVEAGKDIEQD